MDIFEIFELKSDPVQFLNSPLFLLIVILAVVVGFSVFLIRRRMKQGVKWIKGKPKEKTVAYEQPCVREYNDDKNALQTINQKIAKDECYIIQKDKDGILIISNMNGIPCYEKLTLDNNIPSTEPVETEEEPLDDQVHNDTVDKEVDELLIKKKRNFLNRMRIRFMGREMAKQKKEETIDAVEQPQTEQPQEKQELTEAEVFSEDDVEKPKPILETIKPPIQAEGESMRQTVFKLLNHGKTKEQIYAETGYAENSINKYSTDWIKDKTDEMRNLLLDGKWVLVKKTIDLINSKETILIQNGKLYYPGRDKMTYVFIGTTILFAGIAISLLLL